MTNESLFEELMHKGFAEGIVEELREEYKTGGKVLNVEEDPVDRTNPFTGNTYSQDSQMQRLGLFTGGKTSNVLVEGLKKMMGDNLSSNSLENIYSNLKR